LLFFNVPYINALFAKKYKVETSGAAVKENSSNVIYQTSSE